MSVLIKLPGTILGRELSDAIEATGKEIGWVTLRDKKICYEPGSVKAKELQSILKIRKPGNVNKAGFLNKLLGRPTKANVETKPSFTSFGIILPAEQYFNSIEFETRVHKPILMSSPSGSPYYLPGYESVETDDPRFVTEIQPTFEQFLAHLFEILNQKPVAA